MLGALLKISSKEWRDNLRGFSSLFLLNMQIITEAPDTCLATVYEM